MTREWPSDSTLIAMLDSSLRGGVPIPDDTDDPHTADIIKALYRIDEALVPVPRRRRLQRL